MRAHNYQAFDEKPIGNESIYGRDTLHLYTHFVETDPASETLVHHFPVEVATSGDISPGVVGVGVQSTVLQELFDHNLIAGRTYSLYVGTGMERAGGSFNGSNTFGGYDQGRFRGNVHSYSMNITDPNPLNVSVVDIIVNDGSKDVSLFDSNKFHSLHGKPSAFTARITTDQYPMSLPYEITENFKSLLSAEPSGHSDGSLHIPKPFHGTMSIVLDDGFTVTLPNEIMYNASGLSPVAERPKNSDDDFYLSLAWLTQVYVMVDYDSYAFHLAQAVIDHQFVQMQTFCPKAVPVVYEPPQTSSFLTQGLIGAVVGGVIGGLGLIACAIWGCVFWARRRMIRAEERAQVEKALAKVKMSRLQSGYGDHGPATAPEEARSHTQWFGQPRRGS